MLPRRAVRLLVVEDSASYLHVIQSAFNHSGSEFQWLITVAVDGQQAVDILFAEENQPVPLPDMILLDWNLPKLDGNEVLKRIKSHRKLRRIPVLVFSTSDSDKDIQDAYDSHANGFITKPGEFDQMARIVAAIEQFWIAIAQMPKVERSGLR